MHEKVTLIVGASSGAGRQTALYLGSKGFKLSVCARRKVLIDELMKEIQEKGGDA